MRCFAAVALLIAGVGCTRPEPAPPVSPAAVSAAAPLTAPSRVDPLASSRQLVLVTTPGWDSTTGLLRRYERGTADERWRPVGDAVPVVVGRTGLAWDDAFAGATRAAPAKREGDGRAPAGVFALDTVFGFAPASQASWVRLPYRQLTDGSECVDDGASAHYNTVVNRESVPRVDWTSAEPMRRIEQYRIGVIVAYNVPPRAGRGSCIFLHVWAGSTVATQGCTAMDERALRDVVLWMDRARRPMLVQLPAAEHARLRASHGLP